MEIHSDDRGTLYEIPNCTGTQFISTSKPGVRRGDHYHVFKTERFLVLSGDAEIMMRPLTVDGAYSVHKISGSTPHVIEIPPLVAHAIKNTGTTDLILLVQSDRVFNKDYPGTFKSHHRILEIFETCGVFFDD